MKKSILKKLWIVKVVYHYGSRLGFDTYCVVAASKEEARLKAAVNIRVPPESDQLQIDAVNLWEAIKPTIKILKNKEKTQ